MGRDDRMRISECIGKIKRRLNKKEKQSFPFLIPKFDERNICLCFYFTYRLYRSIHTSELPVANSIHVGVCVCVRVCLGAKI